MRKMMVVAAREYKAAVKTKSFIITILVMPLLMGGSIIAQLLLKNVGGGKVKKVAVIDRTEGQKLYKPLENAVKEKEEGQKFEIFQIPPGSPDKIKEQRLELSKRVEAGEFIGFLEIGPEVIAGKPEGVENMPPKAKVRYQSNKPTDRKFYQFAHVALTKAIFDIRAGDRKVKTEDLHSINRAIELEQKGLTRRNSEGEIEDEAEWARLVSMGLPVVLILLMFMVVMIGATPLMQGVLEEKMQRIAEVLLGSIRPFDLMMGKLLGMTGVSLTLVMVYLGGGYAAAVYFGIAKHVPMHLLIWFLVYQTMAALMFGSLFIAVGAACSEMKETQNLMWPIMMLICLPLFVLSNILEEPNGPVATTLSFVPFATPMLMIARLSIPPGCPMWQPIVGVGITIITTIACVYAAGRVFRVGILMQGKGAKFSEMIRWIFRG